MGILTFKGGVHPPYGKELSKDKPIQESTIPKQLFIPLAQHIGAPCTPTVSVGEMVKKGQLVGKSEAFVSAPIHSPVTGKIKRVEPMRHPLGNIISTIVIEPIESDEREYLPPLGTQLEKLDAGLMLQRVRDAGIVGLGGATFPTHVKLSPPKGKHIDTLIINGCECEPYLTADHRIMLERPADVILGARIIGKILGVKKIVFACEDNKPDAAEKISSLIEGKDIECMLTKTKYPQGAEKMLIKAILDREVPSGGLPLDVGVVVSNVGTAVAVCEAIRDGKPLIERVVTVTGDGVKSPSNFIVKLGTQFSSLVEQAGGVIEPVGKIIMGGPMMGIAQPSLDVPVIKGTSGIVLLRKTGAMQEIYHPCIKCSFCVQACPMHLLPSRLSVIGEAERWDLAEKYGVNDCIECGSCAYVCPAKRPIVQLIKTTKAKLREIKAREKE